MAVKVEVQYASNECNLPNRRLITEWVILALSDIDKNVEMSVRIVDEVEGKALNKRWRNRDYATNVLSFPLKTEEGPAAGLLGDIVICAPVIRNEATEQKKILQNHWAHMVIHGTLHLIGYDHTNDNDAEKMESLEIELLNKIGINNPYI